MDTLTTDHFADLKREICATPEGLGFQPSGIELPEPEMILHLATALVPQGFGFNWYTREQEMGMSLGLLPAWAYTQFYSWDEGRQMAVPDRKLCCTQRVGSLDTFRVIAHEIGHVYTLDDTMMRTMCILAHTEPEKVKTWKDSKEYAENEVLAECSSYLFLSTLFPGVEHVWRWSTVQYLAHYKQGTDALEMPYQRTMIALAAKNMLNSFYESRGEARRFNILVK